MVKYPYTVSSPRMFQNITRCCTHAIKVTEFASSTIQHVCYHHTRCKGNPRSKENFTEFARETRHWLKSSSEHDHRQDLEWNMFFFCSADRIFFSSKKTLEKRSFWMPSNEICGKLMGMDFILRLWLMLGLFILQFFIVPVALPASLLPVHKFVWCSCGWTGPFLPVW